MNACWTGWSRPSPSNNPSTVVTGPPTADTGRSQDDRARPPMSTEHAPHSPIPQPNFGPARPRSWRSTSSNGVSGWQVTLRSAPFTLNRNSVSVKISSSTRPDPGWRTSAEAARSDGLQRFGSGHDPAQGADLVQVAEHLDPDGLVQPAHADRVEAGDAD